MNWRAPDVLRGSLRVPLPAWEATSLREDHLAINLMSSSKERQRLMQESPNTVNPKFANLIDLIVGRTCT